MNFLKFSVGANLNTNSFICILLGPCTPENWLATCKPIIETRMQKYVVLQSIYFPSYSSCYFQEVISVFLHNQEVL